MPATPTPVCPRCRKPAEYQATIEMIDPPVGKIDIGYCTLCACLFEQVRDTGTCYESTAWLPVCRTCRQPVVATSITGSDEDFVVGYQCRDHPTERWQSSRQGERWVRMA